VHFAIPSAYNRCYHLFTIDGSHVSHFLGRARSGIVFAAGKAQVHWPHIHLSPSSLRWPTFTWSPQIPPASQRRLSLWMSELKLMRIPAHMWMSVVRWRASPQQARPRKWLTCEPGLRRGSAAARLLGLRVRIPRGYECILWVLCVVRWKSFDSGWSFMKRSSTACSVSVRPGLQGGTGPLRGCFCAIGGGWGGGWQLLSRSIRWDKTPTRRTVTLKKLYKILFIHLYTAQHVSGTVVPIIRSLSFSAHFVITGEQRLRVQWRKGSWWWACWAVYKWINKIF
jgi:hypothetical protein